MQVVSNPIDTLVFRPVGEAARGEIRGRLGLAGKVVTYAGRLGAEKNIDVLVRAVARLSGEVTLAVAGHGAQREALEALAGELGLGGRVRFFGTLAHARLAELLQVSDVFAIMSTSETQSMVLAQAMACGVAVVAARSRALPELVGPANGVLVPPHDPPALANALSVLLEDAEGRRRMGLAGRAMAEQRGIAAVTDVWEALYGGVVAGRRAA